MIDIKNNYKRMLINLKMRSNSMLVKQMNGLINLKKVKFQKNYNQNLKIMIIKRFTEIMEKNYYKDWDLKMKILIIYMQYIVNMKKQWR